MGNLSQFLPCCFKVFTKVAGNRKSISTGNEKHARIKYPAALPEEIYHQRQFSLTEIKAATNNFHPKSLVREGYFVKVYKGIVDYGNLVAVKRFKPDSVQGLDGFQTEVQLLCQLRHQNLVSLIGYCNDKDEKILVYELMKNGSLRDHLYGCNYDPLPWKQRLEICIGAARGLHYLHTGAKHAVIHRDIKSRNILLDDKWVIGIPSIREMVDFQRNVMYTHLGFFYLNEKGDTRPEMGEVEMMLELALKMQEKADSKMKDVDPHGECTYGEVSFSIPVSDHSFSVDNSSSLESRW
ncbi:PREDICTED: receptor-like protein kinase FERONIA [Theobroma cacao]|uniref:Receptor-like protein kinase FERONIA n=1 Tax=Theobroma cacao TaxID=3641 RepID=A0AB32WZZ2_THECC|nr:PREDICTED: receptor-like protein kinase FERONIA [Theobroma cacao]